jgi:predicted nucleic acid-binding protein
MIVLDTSAAVEYLADLSHGAWVAEELGADSDIHAPHLLDVEVIGVLRRLTRDRRLPLRRAEFALVALVDLDLTRHPHLPLLPRIWSLRANLRASDAAFVALAEALGADIVTTDRRLAASTGIHARIRVP